MEKVYSFNDLEKIIEELRERCPWDKEQTHESLKKSLIEECNEVLQAIDYQDMDNLCEELGDVLLIIMLQSQIGKEEGVFTIGDVIDGVTRKMIRRHPHVFGDKKNATREEISALWEEIKKQEKAEKP